MSEIAFDYRFLKVFFASEKIDRCVTVCHQCKIILALVLSTESVAYNLIITYGEYNMSKEDLP